MHSTLRRPSAVHACQLQCTQDRPRTAAVPGVVAGGGDCGLGCTLAAGALAGFRQGPPMQMAEAQKAAAAGGIEQVKTCV